MHYRPLYLINDQSEKVALLDVKWQGTHFEGTVILENTPPRLMKLFTQFEEIIEGQMFGLLDDVEEKIAELGLIVVFEDRSESPATDLQVFPSTHSVSFATIHSDTK